MLALDAGLLAVGELLLLGLGLVRGPRAALRYAGLAFAVGWAATGIAASFALLAGLEPTVATVVVLWALLAGVALLVALRVAPRRPPLVGERHPAGRAVALGGVAVLLVAVEELCRRALASGPLDPDVWAFWLPRAKTVFHFGGIDTGVGGWGAYPHPDYPPLLPAMEAATWNFLGSTDALLLPLQHWILAVAVLAGLAGLLSARVRPAILYPSLALLALMPSYDHLVGSLLGDEALVQLVAVAAAASALWLVEGERRYAALAALFLAAGALTKNEGLLLALAVSLLLLALRREWPLAALAGAPFVAVGIWKLWLAASDIAVVDADYRFRDAFDPSYLADRLDRLGTVFTELPRYLFDPGALLLAVPLTLALAVLAPGRLAAFAAGTLGLAFLGYLAIYWIGKPEIDTYLDSSAGRITVPLGVLAAVLFPLLLDEALRRARPAPAGPIPNPHPPTGQEDGRRAARA